MELVLRMDDEKSGFAPGARVRGVAEWRLNQDRAQLEVRLVWQTRGIGSLDTAVAAREVIASPRSQGEKSFSFDGRWEPYSFSGKLVSVEWRIEFGVTDGDIWTFQPIVIAPDGREVDLPVLEDEADAGA